MFNGQYTHVKRIIEVLYRKYGIENIYIDEVKELVWECLSHLGRHEFLERKTIDIKIANHKGLMPDDIQEGGALGIRDKETNTSLIPSSDIYFEQNLADEGTIKGIVQGISYTAEEPVEGDRVELQTNELGVEIAVPLNKRFSNRFTYRIDANVIFCGIKNTILELSYIAFPVWDDGTPKIPDDSKVIRAVVSFIAMSMAEKLLWTQGISDKLYDRIAQDYAFNVGAARNRLLQPDINEMEAIRKTHMRLIPKPNNFKTGFRDLTNEEQLGG